MKTAIVPYSTELGNFFRDKREEANLTQMEVAQHLGYTSSQMVSKWERGLCGPKFEDLVKIRKLYKINKSELLDVLIKEQKKIFFSQL